MNSENQHHTIYQKFTMKVDTLKSRLATSIIRNEPISNEEILQAENELLHEIYPSQIEIGQILREAREDLKNSLEDVAKSLRIKKEYLMALEEGNFDSLPGTTYVSGFLKSYTQYLGLNIDQSLLRLVSSKDTAETPNETILGAIPDKKSSPNFIIIAFSIVATGIGYFIWNASEKSSTPKKTDGLQLAESEPNKQVEFILKGNKNKGFTTNTAAEKKPTRTPEPTHQQTTLKNDYKSRQHSPLKNEIIPIETAREDTLEATESSSAPSQKRPKKAEEANTQLNESIKIPSLKTPTKVSKINSIPAENETKKIYLKAIEDCWLEIKNAGGDVILSRIIRTGETIKLPYEKGLSLSTGNTKALVITYNKKNFLGFDKNDRIAKNRLLNKWQE